MRTRTVLVSAALLALCGIVSSQPTTPPPSVFPPPAPGVGAPHPAFPPLPGTPGLPPGAVPPPAHPRLDFIPSPGLPDVPVAPPVPAKPLSPADKSVEELLTDLERVQAQKAELDKKEQELKAIVRTKLEKQAERLKKLGVAPKDAKEPDRVGRIIIEGNTKTPDEKILDMLGMRPGQVLQYPALEAARTKLEKAGFRDAAVEALANELDSTLKDIRVRVTEPKPKPKPELEPKAEPAPGPALP